MNLHHHVALSSEYACPFTIVDYSATRTQIQLLTEDLNEESCLIKTTYIYICFDFVSLLRESGPRRLALQDNTATDQLSPQHEMQETSPSPVRKRNQNRYRFLRNKSTLCIYGLHGFVIFDTVSE